MWESKFKTIKVSKIKNKLKKLLKQNLNITRIERLRQVVLGQILRKFVRLEIWKTYQGTHCRHCYDSVICKQN